MSDEKGRKDSIPSIQALRTLAFLGIFTSHTWLGNWGGWGVSVFFILSGFLMTYNYREREIETDLKSRVFFSWKKISRLYLLHIISMVVISFSIFAELYKNFGFSKWKTCAACTILDVFLLQSWIPKSTAYFWLNGVAWYLSDCVFIYFMYPRIHRMQKNMENYAAIISMLACYMIMWFVAVLSTNMSFLFNGISDGFEKWVTYIFPVYRLGDFFIGTCLGIVYFKIREYTNTENSYMRIFWLMSFLEVATVAFLFSIQHVFYSQTGILGSEYVRYTLLYLPINAVIVLLFAINGGLLTKLSGSCLLVRIGSTTPYAFLIHYVVIHYYSYLSRISILDNAFMKNAICLFVTLILSYVWYKYSYRIGGKKCWNTI